MFNPLTIPLLIVPGASTPVRAGAKVTIAPGTGVNILSGVVDVYTWAVTFIVVPTRVSPVEVLKKADKEVIVPSRGIENAKL
jgi:hypothetical protein